MFVLISTLLSVAILAGIYHLSTKREQQHARKYQLLTLLRIWNPRVLQDKNVQWIRCGRIFGFLLKELPSNL